MSPAALDRRQFHAALLGGVASAALSSLARGGEAAAKPFQLRYLLASCMYGYADVREIFPEVAATGSQALDLWPKVHGAQREQLDALGESAFQELLEKHHASLGCITQYALGPFKLQSEMRLAQRLGCGLLVTNGAGPKGLKGSELKGAVAKFVEQMKPHLAVAEETGVTVAIENHGHNLIESPDALRWLIEMRPNRHLAVAFAPYHLPQDEKRLSRLIRDLGDGLALFYAWEHGHGCMKKLPKEQELLQMPGRGTLDFAPLLAALRDIQFAGWTEIFMHPFPRGVPILDTPESVTAEINRSRNYLDKCLG